MKKYLIALAALLFAGSAMANTSEDGVRFLSYTSPTNTELETLLFKEEDPNFNPCTTLQPGGQPAMQFYEDYTPRNMVAGGCWIFVKETNLYEITWYAIVNEGDFDAGIRTGQLEQIKPYTESVTRSMFKSKQCDYGMTNCKFIK